jgi:hypothetical protein
MVQKIKRDRQCLYWKKDMEKNRKRKVVEVPGRNTCSKQNITYRRS